MSLARVPVILSPRDVLWLGEEATTPSKRAPESRPAKAQSTSDQVRCLFIVARDQPGLWDHLRKDFAEDKEVRVFLDRRRGERRQCVQSQEPERRRAGRRRHQGIDHDLRYRSFVIIHEQQGVLAS